MAIRRAALFTMSPVIMQPRAIKHECWEGMGGGEILKNWKAGNLAAPLESHPTPVPNFAALPLCGKRCGIVSSCPQRRGPCSYWLPGGVALLRQIYGGQPTDATKGRRGRAGDKAAEKCSGGNVGRQARLGKCHMLSHNQHCTVAQGERQCRHCRLVSKCVYRKRLCCV
jgi:hypothetical protein